MKKNKVGLYVKTNYEIRDKNGNLVRKGVKEVPVTQPNKK